MKFNLVNKIPLKLRKNSSKILAMTGTVGFAITVIAACRATTKLSDILDETREQLDSVHKVSDADTADYTEEDVKKDTAIIYVQTGVKITRLYTPSVIIGVVSISALLGSNHILKNRYVAAASAYAAVDSSFKEYRSRVIERFGDRVDYELRNNVKNIKLEESTVDENGKKKTVKRDTDVTVLDKPNDFAVCFDESCRTTWQRDPLHNKTFLTIQQRTMNDILKADGYLFLNTVYKALGFPETKAGQIVGWIYDPKDTTGKFSGFVDFRMKEIRRKRTGDFGETYETVFIIDPNVDGNIFDQLSD